MKRFVFAPAARRDLQEIWEFIAADDVDSADRLVDKVEEAIVRLGRTPGIGHRREDLRDLPVRFWPVQSYLIVYRPDAKPLEVVRILSGYRDISDILD